MSLRFYGRATWTALGIAAWLGCTGCEGADERAPQDKPTQRDSGNQPEHDSGNQPEHDADVPSNGGDASQGTDGATPTPPNDAQTGDDVSPTQRADSAVPPVGEGSTVVIPELFERTPLVLRATDLMFTRTEGEAALVEGYVFISGAAERWSVEVDADWVNVEPTSGTVPSIVKVVADTSMLEAGEYEGSFSFRSENDDVVTSAVVGQIYAKEGFSNPRVLAHSEVISPTALPADLDADGDLDVLTTGFGGNLQWYPNDGNGVFGTPNLVTPYSPFGSVQTVDMDGDGDLDVFATAMWFENESGDASRWRVHHVLESEYLRSVHAGDHDGDGDADLLVMTPNYLYSVRNEGAGVKFGTPVELNYAHAGRGEIKMGDIDADGRNDVITLGSPTVWFKNEGDGAFSAARVVSPSVNGDWLEVGDYDRDGDTDLLVHDLIAGIIWVNGEAGTAWNWQATSGAIGGMGRFLNVGQDTMAVVGAEVLEESGGIAGALFPEETMQPKLTWVAPSDLSVQTEFAGNNFPFSSLELADLDGDGDEDVLVTSSIDNGVAWYANLDNAGNFGPRQSIAQSLAGLHVSALVDVTGDGANDIVSAGLFSNQVFVHERDQATNFRRPRVIADNLNYPWFIQTNDVDGNGTQDLVYGGEGGVFWHPIEPNDGLGAWIKLPNSEHTKAVAFEDVTGDGQPDLLRSTSVVYPWGSQLACENVEPLGTFPCEESMELLDARSGAWALDDLDRDDTPELVLGCDCDVSQDSPLAHVRLITEGDLVHLVDLNGDGERDALIRNQELRALMWAPRVAGELAFGNSESIASNIDVQAAAVGDLDGDDDLDIVVSARDEFDSALVWYEREGEYFDKHPLPASYSQYSGITLEDLDDDGDLDIVFASNDQLSWYENEVND